MTALLVEAARESNMTLLIVSHDADLLRKTADRVISLRQRLAARPRG
ncbi:hypothetical protein [Paenirhodobacter populi]|nr:hypothetical protein [Sinirhodobacter populi]